MSIVAQEHAWCATTPKRSRRVDLHGSGLKSVGSALDVLECFATDGELGVSDIARRLGVAKSTAHRLLQTLASRGFVEQDPHTGQYRLGIHVYELGALALARNELRHAALPFLRQVADRHRAHRQPLRARRPRRRLRRAHREQRRRAHPRPLRPAPARAHARAAARRSRRGTRRPTWPAAARASRPGSATPCAPRPTGTAASRRCASSGTPCRTASPSTAPPRWPCRSSSRRVAIASVSVFGPTEAIEPQVDRLVPVLVAASRPDRRARTHA